MTTDSTEYSREEILAAEFAEAVRQGANPSIDDYVVRNPECGPELRELLLTIVAMEQLKEENEPASPRTAAFGAVDIKRLGDLRIVREVGRGGMGIVYEAIQESLGRTVAVKVLPKHQLNSEKALARFERESRTAAQLHHTNIVPVLGVGTDDGYHYYVMQFIRGVGLDEVIRHLGTETAHDSPGTSPTPNVTSIARKLIQSNVDSSMVTDRRMFAVTQDAANDFVSGSDDIRHRSSVAERSEPPGRPTPSEPEDSRPSAIAGESLNTESESDLVDQESHDNTSTAVPTGTPRKLDRVYWRSIAWIGHRVSAALQYAHDQGILHRDIKPSNLLVDSQGVVSVADFGLAKSIDQAGISRTGDVVGTLRYMAPEQLYGTADTRSDIYSLGVTLYELVTRRAAFDDALLARALTQGSASQPPRPRQIRPDLPADLETIITKAMAAEPAHRYQSAAELSEDLQRFCEDRPILAKRTSVVEHLWRWSRRNPAIAALCIVVASLLVIVAVVSTTARQFAIEQRNESDQTAEAAFDALDEIFQRLAPMPLVRSDPFVDSSDEPIGTLTPTKQSAALLEKMLTFYGRVAATGRTDESYQRRLAAANRRIGDIRQRLGQVDLATESYRRAAELYREVIATEPSPAAIAQLAAVHNELGICLPSVQRLQAPLSDELQRQQRSHGSEEFRTARLLLEPVISSDSPPMVRYELAHTYYLLADEPRTDSRDSRRNRNDQQPTRETNADSSDQRSDKRPPARVARSESGSLSSDQDALLQQATDMLNQLVKEYPESPDYRRLLAMCYMEMAKSPAIEATPRSDELRLEAIELLTALVEKFPENQDYQLVLSSAYASGKVNSLRLDRDGKRQYIKRLETAQEIISDLRSDHPGVPQYLVAHLRLFQQLAALRRSLDGREAVLPIYLRATQVCHDARPDSITSLSFKSVIEIYDRAADLLMAGESGDQPDQLREARSVLQAGIDAFERLELRNGESGQSFSHAEFLSRLAEVRERLGETPSTGESDSPM